MRFPESAARLLVAGLAKHEAVQASAISSLNLDSGPADPLLAEADVAFGQPNPAAILASERLKWVHLTSAGYERYARPEFLAEMKAKGTALTTSSAVYDDPCAQHVVAMMLCLARKLPQALANQETSRGWPAEEMRAESRLLTGQSALLLGFGAIAQRIVELLRPFGMRLMAVRRTVRGDEPVATYSEDELDRLIGEADHVIDVLPGGEATRNFVSAERIARMKPTAMFYNIGRGSTVDQEALMAALRDGRVAGAYLDVMMPEPLPPEHPLWTTPNCYITPHSAGGQAREFERIVEHFLENLGRFERGEALVNRIV